MELNRNGITFYPSASQDTVTCVFDHPIDQKDTRPIRERVGSIHGVSTAYFDGLNNHLIVGIRSLYETKCVVELVKKCIGDFFDGKQEIDRGPKVCGIIVKATEKSRIYTINYNPKLGPLSLGWPYRLIPKEYQTDYCKFENPNWIACDNGPINITGAILKIVIFEFVSKIQVNENEIVVDLANKIDDNFIRTMDANISYVIAEQFFNISPQEMCWAYK